MNNTPTNDNTQPDFHEAVKICCNSHGGMYKAWSIEHKNQAHLLLSQLYSSPEALNAMGLCKLSDLAIENQTAATLAYSYKLEAELKAVREKHAACAAMRDRLLKKLKDSSDEHHRDGWSDCDCETAQSKEMIALMSEAELMKRSEEVLAQVASENRQQHGRNAYSDLRVAGYTDAEANAILNNKEQNV